MNSVLALTNLLMSGGTSGYPWVLWSVLGWGIGLALDAPDAFYPKEDAVERGAKRLLRRRDRKHRAEELYD
ncbi:MAG: 2TM domain-containing protein [Candidatus Hydrogenedentes bacterium]|nr:2TM domain-containing protein [Candidatus Hydrogenedentota bacterium]